MLFIVLLYLCCLQIKNIKLHIVTDIKFQVKKKEAEQEQVGRNHPANLGRNHPANLGRNHPAKIVLHYMEC